MLVAGLTYHIHGSKYIPYAYYFISLMFFMVVPNFLLPAREKKMVLNITSSDIVIHKWLLKPVVYPWHEIESLVLNRGVLQLKSKWKRRSKKYYLQGISRSKKTEITRFLEEMKQNRNFSFEFRLQ